MIERSEPVCTQALISQPTVEALDIGILIRLAGVDQPQFDPLRLGSLRTNCIEHARQVRVVHRVVHGHRDYLFHLVINHHETLDSASSGDVPVRARRVPRGARDHPHHLQAAPLRQSRRRHPPYQPTLRRRGFHCFRSTSVVTLFSSSVCENRFLSNAFSASRAFIRRASGTSIRPILFRQRQYPDPRNRACDTVPPLPRLDRPSAGAQ
jgi:hypothetical protein